jgi:hypothetical protein
LESQKKLTNADWKAGILLAGQSCAIKLGFATDYGGSILTHFIRRKR